jgi:hypothetical protein
MKWLFAAMRPLFFDSPAKGASTSVFLATEPTLSKTTGGYYVSSKAEALTAIGANVENRKRLWELTAPLLLG